MKITNTVVQHKILALEKLRNTKTARKSLKVRTTECSSASTAETDTSLNA